MTMVIAIMNDNILDIDDRYLWIQNYGYKINDSKFSDLKQFIEILIIPYTYY